MPLAPQSRADVIVLANRCNSEVRFRIDREGQGTEGEGQEEHTLKPDAVMTIPVSSDATRRLTSGESSRQYVLLPNSAYSFRLAPGGIGLHKVELGKSDVDSNAADRSLDAIESSASAASTAPTEVISVKLLVDDENREKLEKSRQRLGARLEAASEIIQQHCGIRFELGAFETWESDDRQQDLTELQRDFERKVVADSGWLAIGFTSQHRAPRGATQWKEGLKPFCSHILLSDWVDQTTEMERVELLVHALGQYLGGVESPEPKSVMRPAVGDYRARVRTFSIVFDPANLLAINLAADQIRRHGVRSWSELSNHTKSQLSDIYSRIGKSGLWADPYPGLVSGYRQIAAPRYSTGNVDGTPTPGVAPGEEDTSDSVDMVRFALNDPVRWFRRDDLPLPEMPSSYIEFAGGDRLPGEVVGYQTDSSDPGLRPHLIVRTPKSLTWSGQSDGRVRVRERWLTRIVWEAQGDRQYRPGTVYFRDGRELYFRILRLLDDGVQILQENGVVRIPSDEIAELHFPRFDPWQAYFEQLAILTPECDRRLMQLETAGGGRFTTSSSRFQVRPPRVGANRRDSLYVTQPAWSYDPLWINKHAVYLHKFFQPDEVPLSNLTPNVLDRTDVETERVWRADRNVEGDVLKVSQREFTWGVGTRTHTALSFELPECTRGFRTMVGADERSDFEGEIRVIAQTDNRNEAIFESSIREASDDALSTGLLPIEPGTRRLTLLAGSRLDASGGASKSETGRVVNWGEPLLLLEMERLRAEIVRHAAEGFPVGGGHEILPMGSVRLRNRWDTSDVEAPRYRVEIVTSGPSANALESRKQRPE